MLPICVVWLLPATSSEASMGAKTLLLFWTQMSWCSLIPDPHEIDWLEGSQFAWISEKWFQPVHSMDERPPSVSHICCILCFFIHVDIKVSITPGIMLRGALTCQNITHWEIPPKDSWTPFNFRLHKLPISRNLQSIGSTLYLWCAFYELLLLKYYEWLK